VRSTTFQGIEVNLVWVWGRCRPIVRCATGSHGVPDRDVCFFEETDRDVCQVDVQVLPLISGEKEIALTRVIGC
jgi:hypothetical protein